MTHLFITSTIKGANTVTTTTVTTTGTTVASLVNDINTLNIDYVTARVATSGVFNTNINVRWYNDTCKY